MCGFFQELNSPDLEQFIRQWALVPAQLSSSNPASWWNFVTSQFLHAGVAHIVFNMWYLWIFGDNVEAHFGHLRYVFFYIAAGIVAGLAQLFFLTDPTIPMLGASGAVAGVLGAYWALFPHHRIDTFLPVFGWWSRTTLPASAVLLFWFVGQLISGATSFVDGSAATGGVAWWAHIGGFAFGWAIAKLVRGSLVVHTSPAPS